MEQEFFGFIDKEIHNLDEGAVFQLLQSHGRINDYCLTLAKKFKNNEETLVIHSINKQEFKEAIETIERMSEDEMKFILLHKFGLVLSKNEPHLFLRLVQRVKLTDENKEKLSAILLQVPKHAIAQAASLVKDTWLNKVGKRRQSFYNLAFLLLLETLFTFTTLQELSEYTGLHIYLHKLDLELQEHDDERLETLDASLAANII